MGTLPYPTLDCICASFGRCVALRCLSSLESQDFVRCIFLLENYLPLKLRRGWYLGFVLQCSLLSSTLLRIELGSVWGQIWGHLDCLVLFLFLVLVVAMNSHPFKNDPLQLPLLFLFVTPCEARPADLVYNLGCCCLCGQAGSFSVSEECWSRGIRSGNPVTFIGRGSDMVAGVH